MEFRPRALPALDEAGQLLGWLVADERMLEHGAVYFGLRRSLLCEDPWGSRFFPRAVGLRVCERFTPAERVWLSMSDGDISFEATVEMPEERRRCFIIGPVERVLLPDIASFYPVALGRPRYQ